MIVHDFLRLFIRAIVLFFVTSSLAYANDSFNTEVQVKRQQFIQKMTNQGIFGKIEASNGVPKVWVTPVFHQLDFNLKQKFCGVVYAYYKEVDSSVTVMRLIDSKTGKSVGVFSETYGGLKID